MMARQIAAILALALSTPHWAAPLDHGTSGAVSVHPCALSEERGAGACVSLSEPPEAGGSNAGVSVAPEPPVSFVPPGVGGLRFDLSVDPASPSSIELSPFPPDEGLRQRLDLALRSAIRRYPSGTLGVVDEIFVGATLTHDGRAVGASYLMGIVLIAAGARDAGEATEAHVIRALHHEVSSLLLHAHGSKFDEERFRQALPPGFCYRDERPDTAPEPALAPEEDSPTLDLLAQGFLVPWADRSMEQDFNSYAEVLLQRPELLLGPFAPDSRVGRKAHAVRDFYLAVDPRFETFFLGAAAPEIGTSDPEAPVERPSR